MRWLLLFLCLSASAQPFNAVTGLPFLAPNAIASSTSLLPDGMAWRWKSTDLTNTPVTDWVDEIQSYHLVPFAANTAATWATNVGVQFWATNRMIVTNVFISSTTAQWLCVMKFTSTSGTQGILVNWLSGGEVYLSYGGTGFYDPGIADNSIKPIGTGQMDVLYVGNASGHFLVYTNGLSVYDRLSAFGDNQWYNLGSGPSSQTGASANGFNGVIKEIIVWTNTVGFTSVQASNIHYYCTNTYAYSP